MYSNLRIFRVPYPARGDSLPECKKGRLNGRPFCIFMPRHSFLFALKACSPPVEPSNIPGCHQPVDQWVLRDNL